jgi:hypothetical protein
VTWTCGHVRTVATGPRRQHLALLRRIGASAKLKCRARLTNKDHWLFVWMYRRFPTILKVVTIVQPETLVRWHRAGFRRNWCWKSNSRGGRPQIRRGSLSQGWRAFLRNHAPDIAAMDWFVVPTQDQAADTGVLPCSSAFVVRSDL